MAQLAALQRGDEGEGGKEHEQSGQWVGAAGNPTDGLAIDGVRGEKQSGQRRESRTRRGKQPQGEQEQQHRVSSVDQDILQVQEVRVLPQEQVVQVKA